MLGICGVWGAGEGCRAAPPHPASPRYVGVTCVPSSRGELGCFAGSGRCCNLLGLGEPPGWWEGAGAELEMGSVGVCCCLLVEQEEPGKAKER